MTAVQDGLGDAGAQLYETSQRRAFRAWCVREAGLRGCLAYVGRAVTGQRVLVEFQLAFVRGFEATERAKSDAKKVGKKREKMAKGGKEEARRHASVRCNTCCMNQARLLASLVAASISETHVPDQMDPISQFSTMQHLAVRSG